MPQRVVLLSLFVGVSLTAQTLSLDFFKDKPRSFAKDFYISQFLDQDIKPDEAAKLLGDVNNMNMRLFYKFADKMNDTSFKRVKYCKKLKSLELYKGKSADCVAMGLSLYKATKLEPKILTSIANTVQNAYPKLAIQYRLIAKKSFSDLLKSEDKILIQTFLSVGSKFRHDYYNHTLEEKKLHSLTQHYAFSNMVIKIARDDKLNYIQKSILNIDSSKLSAEANFLLGLNAVKHNKEKAALFYFNLSAQKAHQAFDKSKALFWSFLLTKDKNFLNKLIETKDINLYTLYAYETSGKKPKIQTSIEPKQKLAPFDVSNPFTWVKIKKKFKSQKYANYTSKKETAIKLNSKDTEPHVARLIYNFHRHDNFYLMPYMESIQHLKKERIALILALAKQESQFIPTSVSYSYALGLMQFMPFLAKDTAKKLNIKDFEYKDMFQPKTAYNFANYHLDYLEKSLYHPLFIAYAYNGGLGFTKRSILQKNYFKEGKYEPFLSLEMVPNQQARHYGKKVLANFVIYSQLLGKETTIKSLLKTLKPPHRMHRF